ncbi:MAG: VCBS repeat-containing protein, partial [Planctomycetes bacterium]|nr:VCBS repeat-containing protein [Planctomycetota bacterium]
SPHSVGVGPARIRAGDVDADGIPDLVVSGYGSSTVAMLRGQGAGSFTPVSSTGVAESPYGLILADFDGDGDMDCATGHELAAGTVSVLLSGPAGLGVTSTLVAPNEVLGMAAGDFNGDGRIDLVSAHEYDDDVQVHTGNGSGGFTSAGRYAIGEHPVDVLVLDVNGDGRLDLAVAHRFTEDLRVLLGDGAGGFTPGLTLTAAGPLGGAAAGDLDGDGDLDIVLAVRDLGSVHVIEASGGTLTQHSTLPVGGDLRGVDLADFDGDGALDLVIGVGDWSDYGWDNAYTPEGRWTNGPLRGFVYVARNAGTTLHPAYAEPERIQGGGRILETFGWPSPNLGDFDQDGDLDLLCGEFLDGFTYFQNVGTRTSPRYANGRRLTLPPRSGMGQGSQRYPSAWLAELECAGLVEAGASGGTNRPLTLDLQMITPTAIDWDRDGDLDLRGDQLRVNDGRGVFTDRSLGFPTPPANTLYGSVVAFGDFDGDGQRDALVPLIQIVFPRGSLFLEMRRLREQPGGGFVDVGAAAASAAQMDFGVVTDADSDGDLDFLDARGVWLNNGLGSFTLTGPGFDDHRPIAVGDIDGDGTEDFLGSYQFRTGLAVFLRTGKATYAKTVLYASSYNQVDLASARLADLDDDGDLDVVGRERLNNAQQRTLVFENLGNGTFAPAIALAPFGFYGVGDVDGDGRSDLVIGDSQVTTVLLRNPGRLNYAAPRVFSVGGMRDLVDLDQDGDPDILGSYPTRHRRFEGADAGLRRQYGQSVPGTGGKVPIASVVGALRPGQVASLWLRNAVGGSVAWMLIGATESNVPSTVIPGVILYSSPVAVLLPVPLSGQAGVAGAGESTVPVLLPTSAANARAFFQYVIADTGGNNGTSSHTNGVEVRIGK